jgi:two-component system response regulator AtoC
MEEYSIMVVDDEEIILSSIRDYLSDYRISTFQEPGAARSELSNNFYDIIVCDFRMPGINGLDLLTEAKEKKAYHYGILLTAYADKDMLQDFINRNVIEKVIEKPLKLKVLKDVIDSALEECARDRQFEKSINQMKILCEEAFRGLDYLNDKIIGIDGGLKDVFRKVKYIAKTNENVLITGETGTGKEAIARAIHFSSDRKDDPFVKINCGAIPESLIESELFGYMKGAFSGAYTTKSGKIELADGGTLFLDEIGELNYNMQTRLLHVVQEKRVERLGSTKSIGVNFRLISATNRNLETLMRENRFREDLYYRISTFPIHIPPLRERQEDITSLVEYLIKKYGRELGYADVSIDAKALNRLKMYTFPGNIRELENIIKRAILLLDKREKLIIKEDSFEYLFYSHESDISSYNRAIDIIKESILERRNDLKAVEREIINQILTSFNGNIMEAVRHSGIPKDRFYRNR